MKVNLKNNNCKFGKLPILRCSLKNKTTNDKQKATLYLYDNKNPNDVGEILNSNLPYDFKRDAKSLNVLSYSQVYGLIPDGSDEFIAAAKVSRHFSQNSDKYCGVNTVIEEYNASHDYMDSGLPLLSVVAVDAIKHGDKFILTSFKTDDNPELKKSGFSESKYGNWIMPEKRYVNLIDRAQKRHSIEYLG